MPRVYRKSRILDYRLEARPYRKPFLDFAGNDELVALYCGFDTVEELNRFPLRPTTVISLAANFAMKLRPEQMIPVINFFRSRCQMESDGSDVNNWFSYFSDDPNQSIESIKKAFEQSHGPAAGQFFEMLHTAQIRYSKHNDDRWCSSGGTQLWN
jgi:hypothetical protein